MKKWLLSVWECFRQSSQGLIGGEPQYRTKHVTEIPSRLRPHLLYAIGYPPWSAALQCPCGCGAIIQLSLLQDDSPRWVLTIDEEETPTLFPSVWRRAGCHSHFLLKKGKVIWYRRHNLGTSGSTLDSLSSCIGHER